MNVAELIATLGFKIDNSSKTKMESSIMSMNSSMSMLEKTAGKINTLLNVGIAAGVVSSIAKPIVGLVKETTSLYGEFEQLKGGISTLFGTNEMSLEEYAASAGASVADIKEEYEGLEETEKLVMENASNAYKTAQMSQSEYMSTVTNFAAALKQSTGSAEEAAKAADTAIIAMADNWNKMGSNPEMVKNAYMGLARGNYMMIDNLKLGYSGTKKEMERMVKDASEKSGKNLEMGNLADMFEAIKIIQDELKISGTTEREAMHTLQGSSAMLKASWTNLKTAIGSGEGFDDALEAVFTSAEAVVDNYTPVIERSITGVVQIFSKVVPTAVKKILEPSKETGKNLIQTLVPTFINALYGAVTDLIAALPDVAQSLSSGVADAFEDLWDAVIAEDNPISKALNSLGMSGEDAVSRIKQALSDLFGWVQSNVMPIVDGVFGLFKGIDVVGVIKGLGNAVTWLFGFIKPGIEFVLVVIRSIFTVLGGIQSYFGKLIGSSSNFNKHWEYAKTVFESISERAVKIFNDIKYFVEVLQPFLDFAGKILGVIFYMIAAIGTVLLNVVLKAIDGIAEALEFFIKIFDAIAYWIGVASNWALGDKYDVKKPEKMTLSNGVPVTSKGDYSGKLFDFSSIGKYIDSAESSGYLEDIDGNMELLRKSQYASPQALSTNQTTNQTTNTTINQSNSFTNNFTGMTSEAATTVGKAMETSSKDLTRGLSNTLNASNN